jgi:hypothetical protein
MFAQVKVELLTLLLHTPHTAAPARGRPRPASVRSRILPAVKTAVSLRSEPPFHSLRSDYPQEKCFLSMLTQLKLAPAARQPAAAPAGVFPPIIAANAAIRVNNNCKFEIRGIRII